MFVPCYIVWHLQYRIIHYTETRHNNTEINMSPRQISPVAKTIRHIVAARRVLPDGSKTFTKRKPKDFLLLYTRQRSGSSFVGGLFSHNPLIYYTFEPMNFVRSSKIITDISNPDVVSKRLHEISQCNFRDTLKRSNKKPYWRIVSFCSKFKANMTMQGPCKRSAVSDWENACKSFKYSVSKDIVINSLSALKYFMLEGNKLLHLVRDPRAIVNSRVRITGSKSITSLAYSREIMKISKHCQETSADLDLMTNMLKTNRAIRYRLFRYEDIALDPRGMVRDIYDFSQFPLHEHVDTWINKSTQAPETNPETKKTYGIQRNSTKPVYSWTEVLPKDVIVKVQQHCRNMMKILGYKILPNGIINKDVHIKDQILRNVSSAYILLIA